MSAHSFTVKISPRADDDLNSIAEFGVEDWGDEIADRFIAEIRESIERIGIYPYIGKQVDLGDDGLRSLVHSDHVIYYRIDESKRAIEVIRVLHARRDASSELGIS